MGARVSRQGLTLVNRRDLLLCLDAGLPAEAAARLCGFSARESPATEKAAASRPAEHVAAVAAAPTSAVSGRQFCLPAAIGGTTLSSEFEDQEEPGPTVRFLTEDELRVKGRPPSIEPLMPLPRLWPYLHRVLGQRRPGGRLDAPRAVTRVARGLSLQAVPWRPVQRWAPRARVVVDCTLPPGFVTDDVRVLVEALQALRGRTGLLTPQEPARPGAPLHAVRAVADIEALKAVPVPTLVLSDLGQLRQDPPLVRAWLEFGRRLLAAGVRPIALVPCPRDRWDPDLTAVWRCACWDREARVPAPGQGLEVIADPDASDKAARRAARLLGLLAPVSLIEPELLRAIRHTLPAGEADIGSEFDVRVGGALAVAGHDMALLPQTRRAVAGRFRQQNSEAVRRRVAELVVEHHRGYGPQLRAGEIKRLAELGAVVPDRSLAEAEDLQVRGNYTILRDLDDPEVARRVGLVIHERWEHAHRSREALGTPRAAEAWVLVSRFDGVENPEIPEGMDTGDVVDAMRMVLPDPGGVTRRCVRVNPASGGSVVEVQPWEPYRVPPDLYPADGLTCGQPLAQIHVRRPHLQVSPRRGSGARRVSVLVEQAGPARVPLGPFDGILLQGDCGTLSVAQMPAPPWATCFAWDQGGVYAEFLVGETVFRLRWIPPGTFLMGSPDDEPGRYPNEGPRHRVTIDHGLWLGETPVTQAQYRVVTGDSPSGFRHAGDAAPVESVSWHEARAFCRRVEGVLGELEGSWTFRLPSEAEWEYACRAGSEAALYTGAITLKGQNHAPELDAIAWYGGNSGASYEGARDSSGWPEKQHDHKTAGTHPVQGKAPNAWGLHDMLGNVWEWCQDEWHDSYRDAPGDGRAWLKGRGGGGSGGVRRVLRGGSWHFTARLCRCAFRNRTGSDFRNVALGFRLVLAPRSSTGRPDRSPEGKAKGRGTGGEGPPAEPRADRPGRRARVRGGAGGLPPAGEAWKGR